jgi:hypothetical protein
MGKAESPIVAFTVSTVPELKNDPMSRRILVQRENGTRDVFGSSSFEMYRFVTELLTTPSRRLPRQFGVVSKPSLLYASELEREKHGPKGAPVIERQLKEAEESAVPEGVEVAELPEEEVPKKKRGRPKKTKV